jgi:hypothetical protein
MGRPHEAIPVGPPHHIKGDQLNDNDRNQKETLLPHRHSPLGGGKNESLKHLHAIQQPDPEEHSDIPQLYLGNFTGCSTVGASWAIRSLKSRCCRLLETFPGALDEKRKLGPRFLPRKTLG